MKWVIVLLVGSFLVLAATVFAGVFTQHHQWHPPPKRSNRTRLPNLVPVIVNNFQQTVTFGPSHCAVVEKCTLPGKRKLMRFGLRAENRGLEPIVMGRPQDSLDRFVYSPCHGHYHFLGFSRYTIRNSSGHELAYGHKEAYCLRDNSPNSRQDPEATHSSTRFSCEHQGISAGWGDVYKADLDCQWVDITGLPHGRYQLVARINEDRIIEESNYDDNEDWVWIEI